MRPANQIRPVDRADPMQHIRDVLGNGVSTDMQFFSDLYVGAAFCGKLEDAQLAGGKPNIIYISCSSGGSGWP
jgi:hypothetical protein